MVSLLHANLPAYQQFNFVHSRSDLPVTSLTIENLKIVEESLSRRGILPRMSALPIWFLAETERNVFLWRNGLSLENANQFEFWIDLEKLLAKRQERLTREDGEENPFLGSLLDGEGGSDEELTAQREYLDVFEKLLPDLMPHLHALSCMQRVLEDSFGLPSGNILLLPYA